MFSKISLRKFYMAHKIGCLVGVLTFIAIMWMDLMWISAKDFSLLLKTIVSAVASGILCGFLIEFLFQKKS